MSSRWLLVLLLAPGLAAAADAPKAVPITIRPVQTKPVATATTPVARPAAPAKPAPLPFPAPVLGPIVQDMRYSAGTVNVVDLEKKTFELTTPSGPLLCTIGEGSRVVGLEGSPVLLSDLAPGASVRVYYRTGKGAEVLEADLIGAR